MADEVGKQPPKSRAFRAKLMHADGRIETTIDIMATTEGEAIEQVRRLSLSYTIELWSGGQLIASVLYQGH